MFCSGKIRYFLPSVRMRGKKCVLPTPQKNDQIGSGDVQNGVKNSFLVRRRQEASPLGIIKGFPLKIYKDFRWSCMDQNDTQAVLN